MLKLDGQRERMNLPEENDLLPDELDLEEIEPEPEPVEDDKKNHYVSNKKLFESLVEWKAATAKAKRKKLDKPRLPDYVAESMLKMATRLSQKAGFVNYCVDEETEMLTKRGWLRWDEVTTDDIALSCDTSTMEMKWSPIHEIYRAPFDGNMFKLTGNGLDALVTPRHKFLTQRGFVYVEQLQQKDNIVLIGKPMASPASKTYTDAFVKLVGWSVTEGHYSYGKTTHSVSISQKKQNGIDDIVEALTGTHANWSKYVITEDKWRDYSYESLSGKILTAKINSKGMHIFLVTGFVANEIIRVSPNRVLTEDFIDALTQDQRLLLIDTMISGDGWRTQRSSGTIGRFYTQKDKAHIDAFTSLCLRAGIRTSERLRTIESPFGKSDMWSLNLCEGGKTKWGTVSLGTKMENVNMHGSQRDLTHAEHCRGENHVNSKFTLEQIEEFRILHSQGMSYKKLGQKYGVSHSAIHRAVTGQTYKDHSLSMPKEHEASTPYKGMVWCPRTNYGTFVVKRNGISALFSNTYREDMVGDAIESCLRYIHNFDPTKSKNPFAYITQIIHNAFIRRIQKEQKQLYVKMRIVDDADFLHSYERQDGDSTHYNNSYVTYLQENKCDVISKFESWKESKKIKANAKKKKDCVKNAATVITRTLSVP
jgi:hypothetical protein